MLGRSVSRWTMSYFAVAIVAFVAAQVIMLLGGSYPVQHITSPLTLITVHLLSIGWMSLLMIGALHQFVPVITEGPAVDDRQALFTLVAVPIGLALMLVGFWGLGGSAPFGLPWLPVGGALVVLGILVAIVSIGGALLKARPLPLAARFVAAALAFLAVTVGMGLFLALTITTHGLIDQTLTARLIQTGVLIHLVSGFGGWFSLIAMGVGYKLMAMFTLAPEDRGRLGRVIFTLTASGLAVMWLAGGVQVATGADMVAAIWIGTAAAGTGLLLYLCDMVVLLTERKRRRMELNASAGAASLGALGTILLLAVIAIVARPDWTPGLIYLYLFGWLSGLGLTQLYKIVPFLTWLERFGSQIGRGPIPRVQDLVDEHKGRPWFIGYFAGVALAAAAAMAGFPRLFEVGTLVTLVTTLMITRELWRARQAYYVEHAKQEKGDLPWPLPKS